MTSFGFLKKAEKAKKDSESKEIFYHSNPPSNSTPATLLNTHTYSTPSASFAMRTAASRHCNSLTMTPTTNQTKRTQHE